MINKFKDSDFYDRMIFRKRLLFESDESFIRRQFESQMGYTLRLAQPETFVEKINWLSLYYRPPWIPSLVDKHDVREFVRDRVGRDYLNEAVGVYDRVENVPWDRLPNSFAIKATHASGWNIICPDKEKLNQVEANQRIRRWLRHNFYWYGREWVYRELAGRVIIEQFIDDGTGDAPEDYKFYCFNGEPRLIQLDAARFRGHKRNFYATDWTLLPVTMLYPQIDGEAPPPRGLEEMLDLARRLSKGFPFVRVDLYQGLDGVFFGELTFIPERGFCAFSDPAFDREVGDWLSLPPPVPDKGFWSRLGAVL